jgi:ABC-type transport system involved in multi-copper enzyme maturation permease subunit
METIWTITRLTIREAQRRRILWIGLFAAIAFLLIFGIGYHYIMVEVEREMGRGEGPGFAQVFATFLVLAGLYVVHFLGIALAALLSAGTLSGEVESHTIETLLTKPLRRWQVVLGKWAGYVIIVLVYMALMMAGILLIARLRTGLVLPNLLAGLGSVFLSALVMLSVTILGGTRLSTLANGALAFTLFGLAFLGGWIEQFGAVLRNEMAVNVGIVSSLLNPADVLWKRAILAWRTGETGLDLPGPFFVVSQPSPLMTQYAILYTVGLLGIALWSFSRRDL